MASVVLGLSDVVLLLMERCPERPLTLIADHDFLLADLPGVGLEPNSHSNNESQAYRFLTNFMIADK